MGTLMATCPITGRDVEIGVDTDKRSLAAAQRFFALFVCSGCGEEHALSHRDTWVCETIGGLSDYSPEAGLRGGANTSWTHDRAIGKWLAEQHG